MVLLRPKILANLQSNPILLRGHPSSCKGDTDIAEQEEIREQGKFTRRLSFLMIHSIEPGAAQKCVAGRIVYEFLILIFWVAEYCTASFKQENV